MTHGRKSGRGPRFHVEQVVFVDEEGSYGKIVDIQANDAGTWSCYVEIHHEASVWLESGLRALTGREIGGPRKPAKGAGK